jgi:drug/metabolite transporter superfamily protein YnfA
MSAGFFRITSLTITYFHTGCSTIIGAELFHGPVRDGKGWYQLAMVIRHNLYCHGLPSGQPTAQFGRSKATYTGSDLSDKQTATRLSYLLDLLRL